MPLVKFSNSLRIRFCNFCQFHDLADHTILTNSVIQADFFALANVNVLAYSVSSVNSITSANFIISSDSVIENVSIISSCQIKISINSKLV